MGAPSDGARLCESRHPRPPVPFTRLASTRTARVEWVAQATRLCRPATGRTAGEGGWHWNQAPGKVHPLSPFRAAGRRPAQASGLGSPPKWTRPLRSSGFTSFGGPMRCRSQAPRSGQIPTEFRPPAQRCEARATLGDESIKRINRNAVVQCVPVCRKSWILLRFLAVQFSFHPFANVQAPMKSRTIICSGLIVVFCAIISFASCRGPESRALTVPPLKSSAPTGVYAAATPVGNFTIHLNENGDYSVRAESAAPGASQIQQGRWNWSGQRQEFLLTPSDGSADFQFEFRRLRVDQSEPRTLQWIPLQGVGASAGAADYVRFKREKG